MTDYNVPVDDTSNPFDQFDAEEHSAVVSRPSLAQRFRANMVEGNVRGSIGGAAGLLAGTAAAANPRLAEASQAEADSYRNTDPDPVGDETPLQAITRARAAQRRAERGVQVESVTERVARIREELAGYEAMPEYSGVMEGFTAILGQMAGGMASPESLINRFPGVGKLIEMVGPKIGLGVVGKEIANSALSQGIVNAATDPFVQAMSLKSGVQNEYEFARTALAFPMGAAFGGGMHAAGVGAGSFVHRTVAAFNTHRLRLAIDDPGFRAPGEVPSETPDIAPPKAPEIDVQPMGEGALVRATDPQGGESVYTVTHTDEGFVVERARTSPDGQPIEGGRLDENGNVIAPAEDGQTTPVAATFANKDEALAFVRRQEGEQPEAPAQAAPALPDEVQAALNDVGDALGIPRAEEPPAPTVSRWEPPQPAPRDAPVVTARLAQQIETGEVSVSAGLSAPFIREELGADVPGTLIRGLRGIPERSGEIDGIPAWHGSPHEFDRFSLDRVGTGEGNQSYGHGLYFAESKNIAGNYQSRLTPQSDAWQKAHERVQSLTDEYDRVARYYFESATQKNLDRVNTVERKLKAAEAERERLFSPGSLYEVRIAADPAKFLDWDKPLSEQRHVWDKLPQEVRDAIDYNLESRDMNPMSETLEDYTGRHLYQALAHHDVQESLPAELPGSSWVTGDTTSALHTSKFLESLGLEGIRYLDGSSRRAGEGTSNFVVFDDNKIQIVGKNGEPVNATPLVNELRGQASARLQEHHTVQANYQAARAAVTTPLNELPPATPEAIAAAPKPAELAPVGPLVFEAASLKVDAASMQYKGGGDEFGDIGTLKGVTKWDQAKAGQIMVYQRLNGDMIVANGHQRTSLARRLVETGYADETPVTGLVYREADGITPSDMRAIAAAENISAGTGSPLDAARIIRERPELLDGSINFGTPFGRQALGLSKLSGEAFAMVNNDIVPENFGAIVGQLLPNDPARQKAAMDALVRFDPANADQASILVRRVAEAELVKREAGAQGSMFDDLLSAESTAGEEMKIVDRAIKTLRKDKTLFQRVVANAGRIEETGSQIARDAAQAVTSDADTFVAVLSHNAYTAGPVRGALVQAARELKNGQVTAEQATRQVLSAIRGETETGMARGAGGGASPEGRRAGEPAVPETGRDAAGAAVPDRQIPDAAAVEPGAEGLPQTLIPGVDPVTDRQRLELQAGKPMQGGNAAPPAGGLFDTGAQKQDVLFRAKNAPVPPGPPIAGQVVAGSTPAAQAAVTSLQKQTAALAETLDMPLRQGRLASAQAAAQYNQRYGVARVREVSDFYSVAHEGGHHLETDPEIGRELTALVGRHGYELSPLDYDPARGDPHEGFSEFFALSLTNPAAAQFHAPSFYQEFRQFLGKKRPELLKDLDAAHAAYRAYEAAPSGEKVAAQVVPMEGKSGYGSELLQTYKDEGLAPTIGRFMADLYTMFWDDKAPVTRAVRELSRLMRNSSGSALVDIKAAENPEVLLRLFGRSQQGALYQMRYGVVPYKDIHAQGPSMHDALSLATGQPGILGRWDGEKVSDFNTYLVAKRADVLWDRYYAGQLDRPPVGFSQADARATMAELAKANPNFDKASQMIHDFTRNMLKKQRDAGIITQDLYSTLSGEKFYVPLFRDVSDKPLAGTPSGGGESRTEGPGVLDTVKRLRGSTRDITDPIQGIMMQTILAERTIRHNEILMAFKALAERAGPGGGAIVEPIPSRELKGIPFDLGENIKRVARDRGLNPYDTALLMQSVTNAFGKDPIMGTMFRMELASKKGEPILFYKEGGEVKALRFQAGREGMELYEVLTALPDTISDLWSATMGAAAQMTRAGITTNPTFALTNYMRDQLAVGILRRDYVPFFSGVRGVWDELTQGDAAKLYSYLGGVAPGAAAAGTHKAAEGTVNEIGRKSYLANRLTTFHGILELPQFTEAGTRNSVFSIVYDQKVKQGLTPYEAAIEAAYQATDVLDFGRHGSHTIMMRRIIPFWNATMQGLDKFRRTMLEPLARAARGDIITTADKDALTNAGWALGKFTVLASVLGAIHAAMNADREEYRDASAQMKATHFVIPWGHKVLTIPKPFELAMGFTAGEYAYAKFAQNDPRAAHQFLEGAVDVLSPPNPITGNPAIKTMFEVGLNRSWFTGRDIVPERVRNYETGLQFTNKTSQLAKWIGQASKDISDMIPAVPQISPMKLDYAIGSMFGMWGKDIQAASNWFANEDDKPASMFEDYVFLRRFLKDPNRSSETTRQFFKIAAQKGGEFTQASETFSTQFAGKFQDRQALGYLRTLTDEKKAYAILQVSASPDDPFKKAFTADDRRLNPLTRAQAANGVLNRMASDLSFNAQRNPETGDRLEMTPTQRRDAIEAIHQLGAQEMRNALVLLKEPGYEGRPLLDVAQQFEILRTIAPDIAEQVRTEYATYKVLPTKAVAELWPQAKKLLLRDGSQADLSEIRAQASSEGYEFNGERGTRRRRRSVPVPAAP